MVWAEPGVAATGQEPGGPPELKGVRADAPREPPGRGGPADTLTLASKADFGLLTFR